MKPLSADWLTGGLLDAEYKRYTLLAYLQGVKKQFDTHRLYPSLGDLVFHYQNLIEIKEKRQLLAERFPKVLTQADLKQLTLTYEQLAGDDELMAMLEDIIGFAIPRFKLLLQEGKDLFEYVEEDMELAPVGLSPLYKNEGYLFLLREATRHMLIYRYQLSVFEGAQERYRGLHLELLEDVVKGLGQTLENIKVGLVRRYPAMPNPATYLVHARVAWPFEETLLPVAKRMLMRHLGEEMRKG